MLLVFCLSVRVLAEPFQASSFSDWKSRFASKALAAGISQQILDDTLKDTQLDPKVLELDSSQPEFSKPIWSYLDRATQTKRVKKGIGLIAQYQPLLAQIEQRYAVPKEIIVAIWAMESEFGENYGHNNIIRSLATLAYHGKRADFAESELIAALNIYQQREKQRLQTRLCYARGLNRELIGSWAGAMGQPQFMPSSYLERAVDHDRDGRKDLWHSLPDVFASIANFLKQAGWNPGHDWGWEVSLAKDFDWSLNTAETQLTLEQWKTSGVTVMAAEPEHHDVLASLFIPAGKSGPVFLVTDNFDVIRQYNKSSSYALAVAQLSRLFAGGEAIQAAWPRKDKPLSLKQKKELQSLLLTAGFDAGKIDGKIGKNTQRAIHAWQMKQGLAGDGYANLDVLKRLKMLDQKR